MLRIKPTRLELNQEDLREYNARSIHLKNSTNTDTSTYNKQLNDNNLSLNANELRAQRIGLV